MGDIGSVKRVDVDSLIPYVNNAKIHSDEQVTKIASSIREFGFLNPVLIDKDKNIIAGHGRVMAAKKLGLEKVPVLFVEGLTEAQRKAYILADNRLGELADWDMDLVKIELEDLELANFDIDLTGFDINDFLKPGEVQEVDVPDLPKEAKAKPGDIYQLGCHRLMCGDSTSINDVERLMNGLHANLIVTDPPYNVNYEGSAGKIKNDNMENDKFRQFLIDAFTTMNAVMNPGASFYIWHADSEGYNFRGACDDVGLRVRECLIWVKNSFVLGRSDYQWQHEPCLYGWKDGAAHTWNGKRKQKTVIESLDLMGEVELRETIKELLSEDYDTTILRENKPLNNKVHPTMKPINLLARLIRNSSNKGDVVLDVFGGSGSTLIACEQLDRICYTSELDPRYVDVIIERYETFTGKKAVLLNG